MKIMKVKRIFRKLNISRRLRQGYKYLVYGNEYSRKLRHYFKMDADRALKLFYNYLRLQIKIRPRIRLFSAFMVILTCAFFATGTLNSYVKSKEGEIKINGQVIMVAEKGQGAQDETQEEISQEIVSKPSPFEFRKPVEEGVLSQGYRYYHRANDFATSLGSEIHPVGAGVVEFTGTLSDGKGNVVVISHGDGLKTLYAHMGKISVGTGNNVNGESVLGTVGMTGRTTGPHVHLEVYDNEIMVDPDSVLPE